MKDYPLSNFEAKSFERLIQAISVHVIGPQVIVYGDGPDGGREVTFEGKVSYSSRNGSVTQWDGYGVIQAKFRKRQYDTTGSVVKDDAWALRELRKELEEFVSPLSKRRKPDYYVFATNVILTPVQGSGSKDKAFALLEEYSKKLPLKGYAIWDFDQICAYLDAYPSVRNTFREFLTTSDVLARLIESVGTLEDFLVNDELEKVSSVFVPPAQYKRARELASSRRAVVLSGPPHIGKTATALCLADDIRSKENLIDIVRLDPRDNIKPWMNASNLVIIIDDCFGEFSADQAHLANSFTRTIEQLVKRNVVICTTRSLVLQEARHSTRIDEDRAFSSLVVELEQEGSYDDAALAQILLLHLRWMSEQLPGIGQGITNDQAEFARRNVGRIIKRLRFPHNIERFCRTHLSSVIDTRSLDAAIEDARGIEEAVQKWARGLKDSSRWLVSLISLFPGVRIEVLQEIYGATARTLQFSPESTEAAIQNYSAYLTNPSRPHFRHPSYAEAILALLQKFHKREVGRIVDQGLGLIMKHDIQSFTNCVQADYGWPRPSNLATVDKILGPDDRPFVINPYLEQLSESYRGLRSGIFSGLKPILEPCHCPNDGMLGAWVQASGDLVGLMWLPNKKDSPPYVFEVVEDVTQETTAMLYEAVKADVPMSVEYLLPHDLGQRSPQMHALQIMQRQVKRIFHQQQLPEPKEIILLRMELVLQRFYLHDCTFMPPDLRFNTNWINKFDNNEFERIKQHFERLMNTPCPPYFHESMWERKLLWYRRVFTNLCRASDLLDEYKVSYDGPLIPQRDRIEEGFYGSAARYSYTLEGMEAAMRRSIEIIIQAYQWIVDFAFLPLKGQMPSYRNFPLKVVCVADFCRDNMWGKERAYLYFLPSSFPTHDNQQIELHLRELREEDEPGVDFSPESRDRLEEVESYGALRFFNLHPNDICSPKKIIEIVYEWLENDLDFVMGWENLGKTRDDFLFRFHMANGMPEAIKFPIKFVDPWAFYDWEI